MKRTPLKAKKGLKSTKSLTAKSGLKSKSSLKKSKAIKSKSSKGRDIDKQYQSIIRDIDREHICGGCGATSQLTNSHLIPRSRRPDLIANIKNIVIDCLSCHDKWEKGGDLAKQLNNYDQRMQVLTELDYQYFLMRISRDE